MRSCVDITQRAYLGEGAELIATLDSTKLANSQLFIDPTDIIDGDFISIVRELTL